MLCHKKRGGTTAKPVVHSYSYEMFGHCHQTADKHLEPSGKSRGSFKTRAATPCIGDHLIPCEELEERGALSSAAARIVLKALYVARIARYDFMWSVNMLAREVTTWTVACDRRLHRLICYMHQTSDYAQICFVGDAPGDCCLTLFFSMLVSQATLGIQNQLLAPFCALLALTRSYQ